MVSFLLLASGSGLLQLTSHPGFLLLAESTGTGSEWIIRARRNTGRR